MAISSFFRELKRRNIYKVSVVYGITGWVIVQIASIAAEAFGAPSWVMKMVITAILLGFPVTLIMAWAFEVTPEGVRRTETNTSGGDRYFWAGTAVVTLLLFGAWWFMVADKGSRPKDMNQQTVDRSIAVLPFNSVSSSGNALPLAEGLHDDLLTRLANISDLKVISRTSVEKFGESNLTLPAIADSLGVRWIMEGGVQQTRDKVSINAQLIDPRMDTHIWGQTYERDLTATDLFAIQGEMAREIAEALQAELSAGEQERIAGAPTQDLEAYRLYVQGRQLLASREPDSLLLAQDYFKRALGQDSSYALAWTGLADARLLQLTPRSDWDSVRAVLPEARTAIQRALDLNPNLAEAYASKGNILRQVQMAKPEAQNGPQALRLLQKAVDLKPSYPQAHHWLGQLYLDLGQPEPALQHLLLAVDLNPRNRSALKFHYYVMLANHNYEEAIAASRQYQHRYPGDREMAMRMKGLALLHLKRWEQVRNISRQYRSETEDSPPAGWSFVFPALADVGQGDTVSARRKLSQFKERWNKVTIQAAIGELDAAFEGYNKLINNPPFHPAIIGEIRYYYPDLWKSFRRDPRYEQLIGKINEMWGLNPDGSIPEESKYK